jgi:ribosomal protein L27
MEGQKTVLGKVSGTGNDESIFAVIALKVLD